MTVPGWSPAPLSLDTLLSPEWLSEALGAAVVGSEIVEQLVTVASKVRFRVDYAPGVAADRPRDLCVKGYFASESAAFSRIGEIEVRFYRDLAPMVLTDLGVEVPGCVYTGIDPETGHGIVIMRDLVADGCRFLTALSPYGVDRAAATLEALARLHHADPVSAAGGTDWLAPRLSGYMDYVTPERLAQQLADGRSSAFSPAVADEVRLRTAFRTLSAKAANRPECVVHGDAHAGNVYLTPDGRPGLIDWQVLQLGPWALDVAYHLGAVLDVADRQEHERSLLDHYLGVRHSLGDPVPTPDAAWDDYRDSLVYGFWMWAITQRVERPVIETFVTRLGSAVEYHESLDRLGA